MSQVQLLSVSSPSVSLHQGRPATNSQDVATFFKKRHTDVLRDIASLMSNCPELFSQRNFALAKYTDEQGKSRPMYHLYRDGFMLLVMGYTGKKALAMKLAYIEAFNRMEAELAKGHPIPELPPASLPEASFNETPVASIQTIAEWFGIPEWHVRKAVRRIYKASAMHWFRTHFHGDHMTLDGFRAIVPDVVGCPGAKRTSKNRLQSFLAHFGSRAGCCTEPKVMEAHVVPTSSAYHLPVQTVSSVPAISPAPSDFTTIGSDEVELLRQLCMTLSIAQNSKDDSFSRVDMYLEKICAAIGCKDVASMPRKLLPKAVVWINKTIQEADGSYRRRESLCKCIFDFDDIRRGTREELTQPCAFILDELDTVADISRYDICTEQEAQWFLGIHEKSLLSG